MHLAGSPMARLGSIPRAGKTIEFLYEQRHGKSAPEIALQHSGVGSTGLGWVTAGLQAANPLSSILHKVTALDLSTNKTTNINITNFFPISMLTIIFLATTNLISHFTTYSQYSWWYKWFNYIENGVYDYEPHVWCPWMRIGCIRGPLSHGSRVFLCLSIYTEKWRHALAIGCVGIILDNGYFLSRWHSPLFLNHT